MRRTLLFAGSLAVLVFTANREARADQTLTFDGTLPPDKSPEHVLIPFQVPDGTQEIEVLHKSTVTGNTLDFGLNDPNGYRGWGGGTSEDAIVGANAASRAYVPGPMPAGTWNVIIGEANIATTPATYHIEVTLRTTATLPPQTDRKPYVASAPLATDKKYYACDFHVHDRESTDASPYLEDNVKYAETVGLDAIEASDHNTITQMDYMVDLQARHPHLLIIPGDEWTTYHGHGNAIGTTTWIDHKIGLNGQTAQASIDAMHAGGALFAINHPALQIGALCIGCAWTYSTGFTDSQPFVPVQTIDPKNIDAFEIESGGYRQAGFLFTHPALQMWDQLLDTGAHITAIGGSDDHSGGDDSGQFASAIGNPTTYVMADNLSVAAILDGVKNGRTVVKMQDIHDPMVEFTSEVAPNGDTVSAKSTIFQAKITGGKQDGVTVHFVHNGQEMSDDVPVTSDPFTISVNAAAPQTGEDRWRVELLVDEHPRTVTSHIFLKYDPNGPDPVAAQNLEAGGGCGISQKQAGSSIAWIGVVLGGAIAIARRRRK